MKKVEVVKFTPGGSNSYLIKGSDGYLLADAGMKGASHKLYKQFNSLGIKPEEVKHIVITHDHYDHTGGLSEVRQMTEAMVLMHKDELKNNSKYNNQSRWFFKVLVKVFGALTPEGKPEEKIKPDIVIDGDMDLHVLGYPARIIHTPGHTPGSICIITDDGECIAGDTLFNIFPGTHYPIIVYDRIKLSESYKKLDIEDCSIYYPGHGEVITKQNFKKRIMAKIDNQ